MILLSSQLHLAAEYMAENNSLSFLGKYGSTIGGFFCIFSLLCAGTVHAQTYGGGLYGGGVYGTGEVAASVTSDSSTDSGSSDSGSSVSVPEPAMLLQASYDAKLQTNTISGTTGKSLTLSINPSDVDQLQGVYVRVLGKKYDLKKSGNTYTVVLNVFTKPGSYPYALTLNYGFTTQTQYGVFVIKADSTATASSIRALFAKVHGRIPTLSEEAYWIRRLQDKPELSALVGAMEFHKARGRTVGSIFSTGNATVRASDIPLLFQFVYNRAPFGSEWTYWINRLKDKAARIPFIGALQWHFFNNMLH
jgi:hypothetical protein